MFFADILRKILKDWWLRKVDEEMRCGEEGNGSNDRER
jgi:hypothetical protein